MSVLCRVPDSSGDSSYDEFVMVPEMLSVSDASKRVQEAIDQAREDAEHDWQDVLDILTPQGFTPAPYIPTLDAEF